MPQDTQPTRPMPRAPQPRLTPPSSNTQPKTRPMPAAEGPTTRVLQKAGIKSPRPERNLTSRSIPKQSKPPSPALLVAGIVGTLLLMIVIIAAAAGSGVSIHRGRASNTEKVASKEEPATLEREALADCEKGRDLILRSYNTGDRTGLQRGVDLIIKGNTALERVNQMTGRKFDTRPYNEALKMARQKLMELK